MLLGRLRAKYDPGIGEVGGAAARLLLTAAYPAAILFAAWRAGGAVAGWLGLRAMGSGERALIAPALGLGLLAPAFLAAAVCGLVAAPLPAALVCLVIALGGSPPAGRSGRPAGRFPAAVWVPAALTAAALAWDLPGAFGPEWFEDGRTYHLGLPDRFLLTGKMPVMPGHLLGFLPLNGEMLYLAVMGVVAETPGLGTVREEAARLFNWSLGLLAAGAVGVLAARLAGAGSGKTDRRLAAAVAAWLFVSMPVTMVENEICFTDNLRVLLETTALILVLRGGMPGLLAGGACAGSAMGVKYLAVIRGGLLAGVTAARRRPAGWFVAVASLVLAPWLARNWQAAGDPVYPFLPGVFRPLGFERPLLERWMQDNRHYGVAGMTWRSWASLPVRCSLRPGESDFGTFTTGPMLLGLAPLCLAGPWPAAAVGCAAVAGAEGLIWSVTSHLIRYLLPALAIACALAGWRIATVAARSPGYGRVLVGLVVLWGLPAGVMRVHHRINLDDLYQTTGTALGRGGGVEANAGRGFGPEARTFGTGAVLLVGEDRVLGLGRRWVGASRYDLQPVKRWAADSRDAVRFAVKVRQAGTGAVIMQGNQFRAWLGRGPAFDLTPAELARINPWWKRLRVVWRRGEWEGSIPPPRPPAARRPEDVLSLDDSR